MLTHAKDKDKDAPGGKRRALLDAALDLFAERGFHGTAVPLVAERAKVGAGTVYRYFESKESLVNELYREQKQAMGAALLGGLDLGPAEAASAKHVFEELWARLGAFARTNPKALTFLELHHHAPYLDAASLAVDLAVLSPLRDFVVLAQERGALKRVAPEVIMAIVFGAFAGLIKASHAGYMALDQTTLDEARTCMWQAISG